MRAMFCWAALALSGCTFVYSENKALEGDTTTTSGSGATGASSSDSGGSSSTGSTATSSGTGTTASAASTSSSGTGGTSSSGTSGSCVPNPNPGFYFGTPVEALAPVDVGLFRVEIGGAPAFAAVGYDHSNEAFGVALAGVDAGLSVGPRLLIDYDGGSFACATPARITGVDAGLVLGGSYMAAVDLLGSAGTPAVRQRFAGGYVFQIAALPLTSGRDDLVGWNNNGGDEYEFRQYADGGIDPSAGPTAGLGIPAGAVVMTAADIAGDGELRLVFAGGLADGGGEIDVVRPSPNSAQGTAFFAGVPVSDRYALRQFIQDIDGDGRGDVVLISEAVSVVVLHGLPDAGVGPAQVIALENSDAGLDVTAVGFGDLDGDCQPDAILAGYRSLNWLPARPDGGFGPPQPLSHFGFGDKLIGQIHLVDLNRDGKLDMVFADSISDSNDVQLGYALQQ